jgi:hypothetical protein
VPIGINYMVIHVLKVCDVCCTVLCYLYYMRSLSRHCYSEGVRDVQTLVGQTDNCFSILLLTCWLLSESPWKVVCVCVCVYVCVCVCVCVLFVCLFGFFFVLPLHVLCT